MRKPIFKTSLWNLAGILSKEEAEKLEETIIKNREELKKAIESSREKDGDNIATQHPIQGATRENKQSS